MHKISHVLQYYEKYVNDNMLPTLFWIYISFPEVNDAKTRNNAIKIYVKQMWL